MQSQPAIIVIRIQYTYFCYKTQRNAQKLWIPQTVSTVSSVIIVANLVYVKK